MAENPLLPHQRLKDMYALMQRVHIGLASGPRSMIGLEAVLAATVIQLQRGDVMCARTQSAVGGGSSMRGRRDSLSLETYAQAFQDTQLPELSSLIAFGMKATNRKNVAVTLTSTSADLEWQPVLKQAQEARLSQVFVLVEAVRPIRSTASLTWSNLSKYAKAAGIPTISVDGEDAVAIYRVVQESLNRARLGDGPTVIWCARTAPKSAKKGSTAMASMARYLADRGLLKRSPARSPEIAGTRS